MKTKRNQNNLKSAAGNVLAFLNLEQLVLWDNEISGQISDGKWENATPRDHWRPWHECLWVIDSDHPGRNFWVQREKYNLSAKDLLEAVGERMRYRLTLARFQPVAVVKCLEIGQRLPAEESDWDETEDYALRYIENWKAAGLQRVTGDLVSLREVKKVLEDMKIVMRTFRPLSSTIPVVA